MPIKPEIIDGIVYTEISGEIGYDEIIRQADFVLTLKEKLTCLYELHDHTHTKNINISADDIPKVATRLSETQNIFTYYFLAIYAPSDFVFGLARMFETFFEINGHTVQAKIFRDKDAAIQFLKDKKERYG